MFAFNLKSSHSAFKWWVAFYIWMTGWRKMLFQPTEKEELKFWDTITNQNFKKFEYVGTKLEDRSILEMVHQNISTHALYMLSILPLQWKRDYEITAKLHYFKRHLTRQGGFY